MRDRGQKCEGRKSLAEQHPELIREARRLRRRSPKSGKQRSYRTIAEELHQQGYSTAKGKAYSASMVARLVG